MTLESMTLVVVMMRIPDRQPITKGLGHDQSPQGPVPPVVPGHGHGRGLGLDLVPALQVLGQGHNLGQDHETEREENILDLGQGNW